MLPPNSLVRGSGCNSVDQRPDPETFCKVRRDLLDATQARYRDELHQPEPPAFLLYIDQGEELYVRADEGRGRAREFPKSVVARDPRLRSIMSLRADSFGDLQKDEPLYGGPRAAQPVGLPLRPVAPRAAVAR